jgi:outer membrane receptor protein involved in Fe transport
MYGNGALGGVINILTDNPLKAAGGFDYQGRVGGKFSSADLSSGATLMFTGAAEDFGFLIGGTYDYFGELRVGDGTNWPLSDYQTGYWRAKLVYSPDNYTVSLGYFGMLMRDAGRTDGLGKGETRLYNNDDHLVYTRFEWTGDLVEYIRVTASYQRLDEDVARYNCSTNGGVVSNQAACATQSLNIIEKQRRNSDATNTIGSEAEIGLAFWNNRIHLRSGIDAYYDLVDSSRKDANAPDFEWKPRDRGNFSDGSTYLTLGVFTHADATVMDITEHHLQLRLSGGVRYAHFSAAAPDVAGLGDIDYAFNGVVGSAGVEFIIPQKLTLYTSFMQGFRAPNLQETTVLGDTGSTFEVPNPDLGPERTDTIEAGIKLQLGPVQMNAAYFYSILSDAIGADLTTWQGQAVIDNKQVAHRVNNEGGESQGVEWDMALTLGRWLVSGGVAWISSQYTSADGVQINARRIPPVTGNARVRYTGAESRWYLEFGTRFATAQTTLSPGDLRDARICEEARHSGTLQNPCDGTPAFFVADLRGGYQFTSNLRADLAVSNLFDSLYRRHGSGFDAPGIDARLSLTAEF